MDRWIYMELKYHGMELNISPSAQRHSHVCVMAKPISSLRVVSWRLLTTIIAMLSNSQGELADELTRLGKEFKQTLYLYKAACKEYQATEKGELKDKLNKLIKELKQTMSAEGLYNSACKELQAMSADYLYNFDYQELQAMSADYLYKFACNSVTEKPIPVLLVDRRSSFTTITAVVSNSSQGKLEEERTRLIKELGAISVKDYALGLQAVSATEKRKYEAGTSKGRELSEGEGEDDVTAQYIGDALGSIFKEWLEDDELLFSLSSQLPNFGRERAEEREDNFGRERAEEREDNFGRERAEEREDNFGRERAEEREDNFGRERAEEREHNFAWVEGLGSVVSRAIKFGILVVPLIAIYLLNKNTGKKFDDFALQIKAANEARIGTTGRASPVSYNLNISMFNANISASPRLGFLNREKRGNDVEVTGSK